MGTTSAFSEALERSQPRCCRVGELFAMLDPDKQPDALAAIGNPAIPASTISDAFATELEGERVAESTIRHHRRSNHELSA